MKKDIILKGLNRAIIRLDKITPTTKKGIKSIDISEVSPVDLPQFMVDNNVPDDAYFDCDHDSFGGTFNLSWEIDVPMSDDDILKFKRKRFANLAFKYVYDLFIYNGYKRVWFNSGLLREFNDTTIYDMYMNNDHDRLVRYYSLYFN